MPIRKLSDQLASQIAAGEVIERPASVVKELVENAIDAGATSIQITIQDGGKRLIQIADDGHGMAAESVQTAFLRHATSKITHVDDLNHIGTLGFRGEALAAIAAVSRTTVVTRAEDAAAGTQLVLEGGHVQSETAIGAPTGTLISVENLFFNTPARLKFLKSSSAEKRHIDEIISRYALAYPHIRFRLTHEKKVSLQTRGTGDRADVLLAIYGGDIAREMLPLGPQHEQGEIGVSGFASPPSLHRSNRSQITLFVNGRWVKDTRLTYAIVQAYHTLLPVGRYPLAVIFVTLPAEQVDVNVHPAKTEVRFRQAGAVFGAVQRAVRDTVTTHAPVRPFQQLTPQQWSGSTSRQQSAFQFERNPQPFEWDDEREVQPIDETATLGGDKLPIMRVVGQIGASYIITEGPEGMFLIDQHAAHERILYEQFMAQQANGSIASQSLVAGEPIQLAPDQATLLEAHSERLTRFGFRIEPFGPNQFMVRALPAVVAKRSSADVLADVLADLALEKSPLEDELEARLVRRVCKTAAVKAGQSLSKPEIEALVHQLEACEQPQTCPHGRPTFIHLSVAQLANEFGRT